MKLNAHTFPRMALVLSALVALGGCAAYGDSDAAADITQDSDALRALRSGELAGSLAFGESKTVAYSTYFKALSIDAVAGDVLNLTVAGRSGAGKPMLWLNNTTSATSRNLAQNLNAGNAASATLRYTVPTAGRYILAFRTGNLSAQSLTVSLAARPAACDPDEEECSVCNPDEAECGAGAIPTSIPAWDPASCSGPRYVPSSNHENVGVLSRSTWKQDCGPSGCSAWQPFTGEVYSYYGWDRHTPFRQYISTSGDLQSDGSFELRAEESRARSWYDADYFDTFHVGSDGDASGNTLYAYGSQSPTTRLSTTLAVRATCVRWSADYRVGTNSTLRMVYSRSRAH